MKKVISVIVSCYNAEQYIKNCLDSILTSSYEAYEIVVINDGSTDKTGLVLREYQNNKKVHPFIFDKNKGPAFCRNFGVQHSRGDIVLFLDSDARVKKNTLQKIINAFEELPDAGGIVLKMIKEKNKRLDNAGHFLSPFGLPYELGYEENPDRYQKRMPVFGAKTVGLAVKKDIFELVGGFDEDYIIYGEDTDLTWRIWKAGYKVIFEPDAEGLHSVGGSLTPATRDRLFYEGTKNSFSNLIKNLNVRDSLYVIPLFLMTQAYLMLSAISKGRASDSMLILKGLWWNIWNLPKTLKKRAHINSYTRSSNEELKKIVFGPLTLTQLISKGYAWTKNI